MRAHCALPPTAIAHWKRDQGVAYNELEAFPDEATAREFLARYAEVLRRTGWKVLVEER